VISDEATIYVDMPTADYDFLFQGGKLVEFEDNSTQNVATYAYQFSDGTIIEEPDFMYEFHETNLETVQLLVTTDYGCQDSISKTLIPPFQLFVPNAFSPNGDGKNEIFYVDGIGFIPGTFKMWIYNRWGNLVTIIEDPSVGWDGGGKNGAEPGTYVYRIEVDGYGENGFIKPYVSMGPITLIR
jgi:gliding motility-associated-like protein